MCHIVHSGHSALRRPQTGADGETALAMMFKLLRARGIDPRQCHAYVYGGGNMFPSMSAEMDVGKHNAEWVLDALSRWGICVVDQGLGGYAYRRLSWTVGPEAPQVVTVSVTEIRPDR